LRPVVAKTADQAVGRFSFLGAFFALDCPRSGAWTQRSFGWTAREARLFDDLAQGT